MARVLIVGGGCAGRRLARRLVDEDGHAVRMVTRAESRRGQIEAVGAECAIGDPNRLGTLGGVLDGVTVACWLLAGARKEPSGSSAHAHELHGARLRAFLTQAIDSTVRGLVYEAPTGCAQTAAGTSIVDAWAARNAIPVAFIGADPRDAAAWETDARAAIGSLLR